MRTPTKEKGRTASRQVACTPNPETARKIWSRSAPIITQNETE